jgi:hypothetical protein
MRRAIAIDESGRFFAFVAAATRYGSNADSSRLNWRFGLARRDFVAKLLMTDVTPVMNAASAHSAAMMPVFVAAQGVSGFAPRGLLGGRDHLKGRPRRLRGYRGKAQTCQDQGQQKFF